jgi:endonuclease YncB( thermonuclease family)
MRAAVALALLLAPAPAAAQTEGSWHRLDAVDGDTVAIRFTLRMRGLDTPELTAAVAAKLRLAEILAAGVRVVSTIDKDAYGRELVRLYDRQGRDVSRILIDEGHARPLADGEKRRPWCP